MPWKCIGCHLFRQQGLSDTMSPFIKGFSWVLLIAVLWAEIKCPTWCSQVTTSEYMEFCSSAVGDKVSKRRNPSLQQQGGLMPGERQPPWGHSKQLGSCGGTDHPSTPHRCKSSSELHWGIAQRAVFALQRHCSSWLANLATWVRLYLSTSSMVEFLPPI